MEYARADDAVGKLARLENAWRREQTMLQQQIRVLTERQTHLNKVLPTYAAAAGRTVLHRNRPNVLTCDGREYVTDEDWQDLAQIVRRPDWARQRQVRDATMGGRELILSAHESRVSEKGVNMHVEFADNDDYQGIVEIIRQDTKHRYSGHPVPGAEIRSNVERILKGHDKRGIELQAEYAANAATLEAARARIGGPCPHTAALAEARAKLVELEVKLVGDAMASPTAAPPTEPEPEPPGPDISA